MTDGTLKKKYESQRVLKGETVVVTVRLLLGEWSIWIDGRKDVVKEDDIEEGALVIDDTASFQIGQSMEAYNIIHIDYDLDPSTFWMYTTVNRPNENFNTTGQIPNEIIQK